MKDYKIIVKKYDLINSISNGISKLKKVKSKEIIIHVRLNVDISISEEREEINGGDIFDNFNETKLNSNIKDTKRDYKLNFLYDSNTLIDIKKYIYNKTDIPIESQYLEYEDSDKAKCLDYYYKYRTQNISEDFSYLNFTVSIDDMFDSVEYISNYPIDLYLFSNRESYTIKSNSYSSIGKFKKTNGISESKDIIIYMYDLNQIIYNKEEIISIISKDVETYNMLYYGFLEKLFPMIPKTNIIDFLKNKNLFKVFKKLEFENQYISNKVKDIEYLNSSKVITYTKSVKKNLKNEYIRNVLFSYESKNIYNIKKLFNSFDLSKDIIKVEVYLHDKNVFIERVFKNSKSILSKRKLEDISNNQYISYLTIYIPQLLSEIKTEIYHTFTIYENGLILSNCINEVSDWSNKNIIDHYFKNIIPIIQDSIPYLSLDANNIKIFSKEKSISSSLIYNYSSNYNILKNISNIFEKYESLDNFLISHSEGLKDNIMLMVSHRRRNYFKNRNDINDFQYYLNESDENNSNIKLFTTNSNITIIPRINDIQVDFNNIDSKQYDTFKELFLRIFSICLINNNVKNIVDIDKVRRIKFLKENDPILFNIEKNKYSRLCQNNQQPIVLSKEKIKSKSMSKIDYVKFWNFTRGEPEYYGCDNKKYPYMKFLTNSHPKNYCLPCCKKKQVDTEDSSVSVYKQKHETCLNKDNNFSYDQKMIKKISAPVNRYISIYSCKLEIGESRLMKLSGTLKKFLDNNSKEESDNLKFFIHGIDNDIFDNCQSLKILSAVINNNLNGYATLYLDLIKFLENNKDLFYSLLKGDLKLFFKDSLEFISFLYENINQDYTPNKLFINFINWNKLFLEIFCVMNNNKKIVIFHEEENNTINDSNITPEFIGDFSYTESEENEEIIFIVERKIENISYMYPIVKINLNEFYSQYAVNKILFNKKDYAYQNTKEILNYTKTLSKAINNSVQKNINEVIYIINKNDMMSLEKIYITGESYVCAAKVSIQDSSINSIIFDLNPIKLWDIKLIKDSTKKENYDELFKDMTNQKNNYQLNELIKMSAFQEIFGSITDSDMTGLKYKDNMLGVWIKDTFIYLNNLSLDLRINYENSIVDIYGLIKREDYKNLSYKEEKKALYITNSYNLLLLHLNNVMNRIKNKKIRNDIEIELNKINLENGSSKLKESVEKFLNNIDKILTNYKQSKYLIMTKFINQKLNKKIMSDFTTYFNNTQFDFDKDTINYVLMNNKKDKNEGLKYLEEILESIVTVSDLNLDFDIDLDFIKCSNVNESNYYCNKDKLIIPKFLYKEYLNILYDDLTNDFKKKYILNYNEVKTLNLNLTNYTNSNIIIHKLSHS